MMPLKETNVKKKDLLTLKLQGNNKIKSLKVGSISIQNWH